MSTGTPASSSRRRREGLRGKGQKRDKAQPKDVQSPTYQRLEDLFHGYVASVYAQASQSAVQPNTPVLSRFKAAWVHTQTAEVWRSPGVDGGYLQLPGSDIAQEVWPRDFVSKIV